MIKLSRPVMKCPSPFTITKRGEEGSNFSLITQGFGECLPSVCQWYKDLGLKSHNGLDFMVAYVDCFASHDGTVFKTLNSSNSSPTAGYGVYIRHNEGWWTLYFHLSEVSVKIGDIVKAGDLIGITGNTGKFTVGPHLHYSLYPANPDYNNGWGGAIDPMPYFSLEEITGIINKNMYKLIKTAGNEDIFYIDETGKKILIADSETLLAFKGKLWGDFSDAQIVDEATMRGYIKGGTVMKSNSI